MKFFSDLSTFDKTVMIMRVRYNRISPSHSHASSLPLITIIIIIYVITVNKFVNQSNCRLYSHSGSGRRRGGQGAMEGN